MSDRPLTDRQREILLYIASHIEDRGFPPTVREIGTAFGVKSTNGIADHLKALEQKGCIIRPGEATARALIVTEKGAKEAGVKPKPSTVGVTVQSIPGVPGEVERVLELDSKLAARGLFAWVATGDSVPDGIYTGDLVLVRPGVVEPGQLALVTKDGLTFLQRLGSGPEPAGVHGAVVGLWRSLKPGDD